MRAIAAGALVGLAVLCGSSADAHSCECGCRPSTLGEQIDGASAIVVARIVDSKQIVHLLPGGEERYLEDLKPPVTYGQNGCHPTRVTLDIIEVLKGSPPSQLKALNSFSAPPCGFKYEVSIGTTALLFLLRDDESDQWVLDGCTPSEPVQAGAPNALLHELRERLAADPTAPISRRFVLPAGSLAAGQPADVILTQVADAPDGPVRCGLTVAVDGKTVFSHEEKFDWNFADPGLMAGWKCRGYGACRLEWLNTMRDLTVRTIDARLGGKWHFLLEPGGSHAAAAIATADLEQNLHVPAESAKRAVSYILERLSRGPLQVLVVAGSPATDGVTRIYVSELKRFVKIGEP